MILIRSVVLDSGDDVTNGIARVAGHLSVLEDGVARPLLPMPSTNAGFSERQEVTFIGPIDLDCQLLIDDELLRTIGDGKRRTWVWRPGFYAGEVRAELLSGNGDQMGSWRLDVSPDERKLGRELYLEMLADILEFDPALAIGQEPARRQLGELGAGEDPLVALARLRVREKEIRQALRSFRSEPMRSLRARRALIPLHRIRRVDRHTANAALRQPKLLVAMGIIDEPADISHGRRLSADVPDVERHYDSPANRCLLAMLHALRRRCSDIYESLEKKIQYEERSDTVTCLLVRWPTWSGFLQSFRHEISLCLRQRPFSEVSRAEISAAGLNAISAHPPYARFWRFASQALRRGVDGLDREAFLPLGPTWEIYERWCFIELCRQLPKLLPDTAWRVIARGHFIGRRSDGGEFALRLQPGFSNSSGVTREGFWSVSRYREPDIVFSWRTPGGTGFLVLDAKYRVTRANVLDAMSSAHIYQDSLRMGECRPVASLLLVPTSGGAPWLELPDFIATHSVGVVALSPSTGISPSLSQLLRGNGFGT